MPKIGSRFVVCAALVLSLVACSGSADETTTAAAGEEAWEPEYVDGVLQPLPDGFPEREIVIMIADEAASAEGIQVTHIQEAAASISPVPITLEARTDFTGLGGWEAQAFVNDSEDGKEGYLLTTFAGVGPLADLAAVDVEGITGLTLDDVQEIITNENTAYFISQCVDPSVVEWEPTMEAMVAYTKENPGVVRMASSGGVGGADLAFFSYMKALEAGELDVIPVGGGLDKTTATAACETDITIATAETTLPHVEGGRLDLLMVSGDERFEEFPDVPTVTELGIPGGIRSSKQIVAAPDVPELRIQWLFELFSAIAEDEEYIAKREAFPGTQVFVRNPEETDQDNHAYMEIIDEVARDLGLHIEQQG